MERLDVYDASRKRTGRVIERNAPLYEGERLLIVHLCLFNSKGEMLIQQRSFKKDRYPGCWDLSAGGFARSGEEAPEAVLREASEELGLSIPKEALRFLLTEPFSFVLDDFFMARVEADCAGLHIQGEELETVRWAEPREILELLRSGDFVDYAESLLKRVFAAAREL